MHVSLSYILGSVKHIFGRSEAVRDDAAVWILAVLIIMLISSVILYVEPSFPLAVLGVYIIEVLMYANLFIYSRKLRETLPPKRIEHSEVFQLEQDV